MKPEWSDDEADPDLLVSGSDRFKPSRLVPARWRRRLALAVALTVGLAAGGYAGYTWPKSPASTSGEATPALTARISGLYALNLPYPPYRLGVELRNVGSHQVTVEQARLDVPGFAASLQPDDMRPIRPGDSETIYYGVRPVCDGPSPARTGRFQLRVRGDPSGDVRSVTLRSPVAGTGVPAGYAILCRQPPPGVSVAAETLDVQRTGDAGLALRLRLTATGNGGDTTNSLRVLRLGVRAPGLDTGGLQGGGLPEIPATVALNLDVNDCADAREALGDPRTLEVALLSAGAADLLYAHTDAEFGTALREFVTDRCGPAP